MVINLFNIMEVTLAFTLGVLSVVFVAFVIIAAWGIVRVINLTKGEQTLYKQIEELWNETGRSRDYTDRMAADQSLQVHSRIDELDRDIDRRFEAIDRNLGEVIRHCESYTDSRVDKMSSKTKTLLKDTIN